MTALIIRRADCVELATPYNTDFVGSLKRMIPYDAREFDATSKRWTVYPPHDETAIKLVENWFEVEIVYPQKAMTADSLSMPTCGAHQTLFISCDAPDKVVEAAYRALSRLYHPDLNRDPDAAGHQKMLNKAYAAINDGKVPCRRTPRS